MRNATCAASKTSKVPTQDARLFISYSMVEVETTQALERQIPTSRRRLGVKCRGMFKFRLYWCNIGVLLILYHICVVDILYKNQYVIY